MIVLSLWIVFRINCFFLILHGIACWSTQAIPPILTHFSVAWSVCHLWHLCTLLKPLADSMQFARYTCGMGLRTHCIRPESRALMGECLKRTFWGSNDSQNLLEPKFHYAVATNDTNHESPRHKSCRWLSWSASSPTFPVHCNGLNLIRATQT